MSNKKYYTSSGNVIGSDGEIYNIVDLLQNAGGGGSGSSMRFLFGETDPTASDGEPGDVFLNTNSGDIFKNENGSWSLQGNLRGPQGEQGPEGPQGEQGPAGADGQDGAQGPPGADGQDGFGTEAQYNDIIARLEALENAGDA